jgi:hypothetical protein
MLEVEKMNGKELKIILPIAVIAILLLSVVGIALMSGPKDEGTTTIADDPYTMSIGPILDENNEPIAGAVISLMSGNTTLGSEVTNDKGYAAFSFEEKIEPGEYNLVISKEGFEDNNVSVDLDYSDHNILLHGDIEEISVLTRIQLPPLEFTVGPIWGTTEDGLLEGVAIELRLENATILTMYTNSNGTATFTFDEPPENGLYILNISFFNYTSIEREIIVDYNNETHTLSVIGNFDGIILEHLIPPEPLPPLELLVGPINGKDDVLKGISVELKRGTKIISSENTDEFGIAKFSFENPPKDGDYTIRITAKEYEELNIDIVLQYNDKEHSLMVTGGIIDITLVFIKPPEPPEPKNDPDYYKEFDAFKEFEGNDGQPVDIESILDKDSDGTPEYYYDIEDETNQEVHVEQFVGLNDEGDPEYAPEIVGYEGLDPDPYLGSRNQPRSVSEESSSSRSEWEEPSNITHYDDIVDLSQILDNGTTDMMKAASEINVVDEDAIEGFNDEVGDVGNLISNNLKTGFINGSNSTDANNDSNPERLVIWKIVYKLIDRNGDNKTDKKIAAVQIFDLYDRNSNGVFEYSIGFQGVCKAFDNDYNGHFEDITYALALGDEAKIDGNITNHFKRVGVFYNHTIDKNNDSIYELQRAAIYTVHSYDNNSNGNFELHLEFAGGIEGIDNNSNGKYESLLLVWAGNVRWQKKDNGFDTFNKTIMWIVSAKDKNEDTNPETKWLLHQLHVSHDNNSNGNPEFTRDIIAGYRGFDNNSNGKIEYQDALRAVGHSWDWNDDNTSDANVSRGHIFLWRDKNEDNNPEYQLALVYIERNYDNNSNSNTEFTHKLIRGFLLRDINSDGKINVLRAVHYGILTVDTNDNGKPNYAQGFGYMIHLRDIDGDSNLEYKRAVFGFENRWDNNTDGIFESVNQLAAGYEGIDANDDGQLDIERFFVLANITMDINNDGNPEIRSFSILASLRVYNSTGTIIFARNVLQSTVAFDNNSNGNFDLIISTIIGHVGYNGTQNGSKIDWESQRVSIYFTSMRSTNDNGTYDKIVRIWLP